ncbi:hypothetical protein B0T14DRAFT_496981 [Immersiella caudata]|uniref:Uncharacterized protein n=1 Tax=Immersiella caudata TaxID=314043 RepID=A0AA39WRW4_9PEZI|nr:hypothetical protein B0T14DRAFT_496981 [Immersiella caudata]
MGEVYAMAPDMGVKDLVKALSGAVQTFTELSSKVPNVGDGLLFILSVSKRLESYLAESVNLFSKARDNYVESEEIKKRTSELIPVSAGAIDALAAETKSWDREIITELTKTQSLISEMRELASKSEKTSDEPRKLGAAAAQKNFDNIAETLVEMQTIILTRVSGEAPSLTSSPIHSRIPQTSVRDILTRLDSTSARTSEETESSIVASTREITVKLDDNSAILSQMIKTLTAASANFIMKKLNDIERSLEAPRLPSTATRDS